ncbi:MAG: hypothetical protein B6D55_04290 [Candidatus Omnitrophica bacterium 4484_70.2]|nr:MAG: hypothetical protein B6D55_04290 [Candidatus Omnitrophica bacterium 4484_70.2]
MKRISVSTTKKEEFVDITSKIERIVKDSNVREGVCIVFCPHTTCGLTINENADPSVRRDIISTLRKIVPDNFNYSHLEGNSPAHIKSSLLGCHLVVLIEGGILQLGTWQGIFLCEFDGPRTREVWIEILDREG